MHISLIKNEDIFQVLRSDDMLPLKNRECSETSNLTPGLYQASTDESNDRDVRIFMNITEHQCLKIESCTEI